MANLFEIFTKSEKSIDKFVHYFPLYEKWFSKFIGKSPRILEIGVQNGGSAEMWVKYFGSKTRVIGIDIDPRCTVHASEDIEIIIGDQGSEEFWDDFISKKLNFDIIIDDGSHENAHQILTLKKTYNLLNNGGIYWCEDTHTSYYNCRVQGGGYLNPKSFTEYAKSVIDVLSEHHTHYAIGVGHTINNRHVDPELVLLYNQIQGIHFYDSIVVIEKGPRLHFQRILNSGKTL